MNKKQFLCIICFLVVHTLSFAQLLKNDQKISFNQDQNLMGLQIFNNDDPIQSSSGDGNSFNTTISNLSNYEKEILIELVAEQPSDWNAFFVINNTQYYDQIKVSIQPGENDILLNVLPSGVSGIGRYKLKITTVGSKLSQLKKFILIHQISDLVINSEFSETEKIITNGLLNARNQSFGELTVFETFYAFELGVLKSLKSIYFCTRGNQPILFDELFHYFTDFLDEGGHLFIAGQKIGNSIYQNQEIFYRDYLGVDYLGKKEQVFSINVNQTDDLYNECEPAFFISHSAKPDYFRSNQENTLSVLNFDNGDCVGSKTEINNFKAVYLGFDIKDIEEKAIAESIIEQTDYWFNGYITSSVYDENLKPKVSSYPNPANNHMNIKVGDLMMGHLQLTTYNSLGQQIESSIIDLQNKIYSLDTGHYTDGVYFYHLRDENGYAVTKEFLVNHH